jgi:hypothetical protein
MYWDDLLRDMREEYRGLVDRAARLNDTAKSENRSMTESESAR